MSKASKQAAKKKSVAQKAATKAKKLQPLVPEVEKQSSETDTLEDVNVARELFKHATSELNNATTQSEYSSVIDLLRQAIRLDPGQVDYFVSLAIAYAHAAQHDFALAACEMALRLAPEHAIAAENRRHALKALGLPETTRINL